MNRIKQLREELNLNQEDLGKVIGVTSQAIGLYENEKRKLDTETAAIIADYFNVSIDYLMCKTDTRTKQDNFTDLLGLIEAGFTKDNYIPPTEKQKEQIKTILETILEDNKINKQDK